MHHGDFTSSPKVIRFHQGGGLVDFTRTEIRIEKGGHYAIRTVSHETGTSEKMGHIPKKDNKDFWASIDWQTLTQLEETIGGPGEDSQVTTFEFIERGETVKTVYYSTGAPAELRKLETTIKQLVNYE